MSWEFVLTKLDGTVIGEITNADQRQVSIPHMRVPSASCVVPLDHYLYDALLNQDTLLKCYRKDERLGTSTLAFHGPVVSVEEVGESLSQSINVTAAGPFWRLTKRMIPGSISITGTGFGLGSPIDLGQIAFNILQDCNAVANGFTGIYTGSLTNSLVGSVGPWWLKNAAEAITELSAGASSFEYEVVPTEPTDRAYSWPQIGLMNCAPIIGVQRDDVILEYGTEQPNIASYSHVVSRDGLLTRAYISSSGWPNTGEKDATGTTLTHPLIGRDSDQIAARGLFEEVVSDAGVTDDTLRTQIADFNLLIRKQPRQIVTFRPTTNPQPSPLVEYKVGDIIRARALVRGAVRFDALFRVWGMTFSIDTSGNESAELELVMP